MKTTIALIVSVAILSGCAMTPRQRYVTTVAVSVVAVGAIAVHQANHGKQATLQPMRQKSCPASPKDMSVIYYC